MTSKAYNEAVEAGTTLWEFSSVQGPLVEQLVAMGYRAAMLDTAQALYGSVSSIKDKAPAVHLYTILESKISSLNSKVEQRARELRI